MNEMNDETGIKLERFIEKLFNHPPEPLDGSMTLKNKVFYSNKAKGILNDNNSAYSIFYKGEHIQFTYGNMVPVGGVHRHRIYS